MALYQFAYKNNDQEKRLSFEVIEAVDHAHACSLFNDKHHNVIVYCILRCGRP